MKKKTSFAAGVGIVATIVGYPNDQIVWDTVVGNKVDLGNGKFSLSANTNQTT